MRLVVKKGVVTAENCHDLLRRSLMRFIAKKKHSIFTYVDDDISESECDASMHTTYDSSKHTVKSIKSLVANFKKEWLTSEIYKRTGFARSQLKDRGWTDAAMDKHLGECDCELENPHYKSGAPMRIYHVSRVLKTEATQEWQDWYEGSLGKRQKQSEISKTRAEKHRQALLKQVCSIQLTLPNISRHKLYKDAVWHYNELAFQRDKQGVDLSACGEDFLHRICVNYLRHQFNNYEQRLERIAGVTGGGEAYVQLKTRILNTIAERFTYLSDAVTEQLDRLSGDFG